MNETEQEELFWKTCPICESTNTTILDGEKTKEGVYIEYQLCIDCGHNFKHNCKEYTNDQLELHWIESDDFESI